MRMPAASRFCKTDCATLAVRPIMSANSSTLMLGVVTEGKSYSPLQVQLRGITAKQPQT